MPEWTPEIVVDEPLARRLLAEQFPELRSVRFASRARGATTPPGWSRTNGSRSALARPLGSFLRALHAAEVAVELPVDPMSRADMGIRVPRARERLTELGHAPAGADDVLEAALALPHPERLALVHGDLHLRHAFVEDGRLSGVIDWGDVCRADPAIDLVLVWCALPPAARSDFFAAYGSVPAEALLRARVLSLLLCAVLALHARHEGLDQVEQESLAGLALTLAD